MVTQIFECRDRFPIGAITVGHRLPLSSVGTVEDLEAKPTHATWIDFHFQARTQPDALHRSPIIRPGLIDYNIETLGSDQPS
jgi:hypothetical protein